METLGQEINDYFWYRAGGTHYEKESPKLKFKHILFILFGDIIMGCKKKGKPK